MEFDRISDSKRLNFIKDVLKKNNQQGAWVLDVGCGNGVIFQSLVAEGFNVCGIEISEKTIEKARSLNIYSNVKFEVISAELLVANGEMYDAVIRSKVLEHLEDPRRLLGVPYQSRKPGGRLIVTVPAGKGSRELFVTRPTYALKKRNGWLWNSIQKYSSLQKRPWKKLAGDTHYEISKFGNTNFVEEVFPFSLLTKGIKFLQIWDCKLAEVLPLPFTGGFVTAWEKKEI